MNAVILDRAPSPAGLFTEAAALDHVLATITYGLDGKILRANANYLRLIGYSATEIVGLQQAVMICPDDIADGPHDATWAALRRGEVQTNDCRRVRKDGSEIWIHAISSPVTDADGCPFQVVEIATDITARMLRDADARGHIAAINTSLAVTHFDLDGIVTHANELFLRTMGYDLEEVVGRHHRMFGDASSATASDDTVFWDRLGKGTIQTGEYKRFGRDGREVWLQASYHTIRDMVGRPFKIIEYATDVTEEKLRRADHEGQIEAIHKSHGVITFDMHGTIIGANERFLDAVGYRFDEVEGRHHRMFVDPAYAHGPEYAAFWDDLSAGVHQAAEYRRLGKDGREVWLQATYNPVLDLNGRPFKVVKYATVVTREKLRQADLQGQIASIHKAQCVVSFASDGTILDANDNFLTVTGYRLADVRGRHHRMFVDPVTAESADYTAFWNELGKGHHKAAEYKRLCKDGREIWLQATYSPIFDMNGRPFKVVKYATDITREKLRQADHQGQITAIRKSQCVAAFAMDGTLIDANDNFLQAVGYRLEEIVGRHHRMFVEPGFADMDEYATFWETLRSGVFLSAKFKRIGKGGRELWIQASYNPILDLNGRPSKVIKIATDITADVALAAKLRDARQQAEHDVTTALPNRLRLASFVASALAEPGARLAILYLDLDHFKPINDTFGHQIGDHVLAETANRLRRALAPDQLVARVGGDEFVVAAPNLSDEAVEALCRHLGAIVTAPIHHDDRTLTVGLSIGVSVSPRDGQTLEELLRCADVALYRSKGKGRGSYGIFGADIGDRIAATRNLAEEMRHGIKAGQFFIEYQPRFNARTRTVQSVEALVRWAHPERGRIEPSNFIPLANQSGLIVPLGEWVLRTACQAALAWPRIGLSVNVSPVQFRSAHLIETVDGVLLETGLDAQRLELEITEGVLLDDEARAHVVLDALKRRGVRIAIDEFVGGRSSASYLKAFPIDAIKLDRSFMSQIEGKEEGRAILQAVLGLGKGLGIGVTALGVETVGQLLCLSLDDCHDVQGFLLAEPMPADAVTALLAPETLPGARLA